MNLKGILTGVKSLNFNGAFIIRLIVLAFVFGGVLWGTIVNQVQGLDQMPIGFLGAGATGLYAMISGFESIAIYILVFGIFVRRWTSPSWEVSLMDNPLNLAHFLLTFAMAFGAGLLVGAIWRGPQALVGSVAAFATAFGGWLALKLMMHLFRKRLVWETPQSGAEIAVQKKTSLGMPARVIIFAALGFIALSAALHFALVVASHH